MDAPQVPQTLSFTARLHTRWSDEDTQGVVNNAVYLTLLEEGRYRYFDALGLLRGNAFPFVLAQTNARFLAPLRAGRELELSLATVHVGTTSFRQAYRLCDPGDGTVALEAEALLVGWDAEQRAKEALTEAFKEAVRAFEDAADGTRSAR